MGLIVLSALVSIGYADSIAYNRRVVDFAKRLRLLRERVLEMDGMEVAAAALGSESTQKQRRDFANYLSRIEREKVKAVGLVKLDLISKGLGFPTLSLFFAQIETVDADSSDKHSQRKRRLVTGTTLPSDDPGGAAHARAVSADTLRAAGRALIDAGSALTGLAAGGGAPEVDREVPRSTEKKPSSRSGGT